MFGDPGWDAKVLGVEHWTLRPPVERLGLSVSSFHLDGVVGFVVEKPEASDKTRTKTGGSVTASACPAV